MNKISLNTMALLACSITAIAQTPNALKSKGKNIISIFPSTILASVYYPVASTPKLYGVQYARIFGKANAVRIGFHTDGSAKNVTKQDTITNTSEYNSTSIGLGYNRFFKLSNAWQLYAGLDLVLSNTTSKYNYNYASQTTISNQKRNSSGLYGQLGVLVNLNSHIGLSLETGLYNTSIKGEYRTDTKYTLNPSLNKIVTTKDVTNQSIGIVPNIGFRIRL